MHIFCIVPPLHVVLVLFCGTTCSPLDRSSTFPSSFPQNDHIQLTIFPQLKWRLFIFISRESKWGTLKSAGSPRCAVPAESHSICTDRRRPGPAAALQVSSTSDTCQSVAILMNRPPPQKKNPKKTRGPEGFYEANKLYGDNSTTYVGTVDD